MEITIDGVLMDIITTDYEYEGKKGTSIKLALYHDGKLDRISIKADEIKQFAEKIGKTVSVPCKLYAKNYNLTFIN